MSEKQAKGKNSGARNMNPRLRVNRFLEVLKDKERILILTHLNPDPDAIACAVGLRYILRAALDKGARIGYGGIIGRAENKAMLKYLQLRLYHQRSINFDEYDAVCLVDTQPGTGNNPLPEGIVPAAVIDHHPKHGSLKGVPYAHVSTEYGASSSIMTDYLMKSGIPVDSKVATALLYGIKSDTEDIGRKFNKVDKEAFTFLYPLVERNLLSKIEHEKVPREYFQVFSEAIQRAELYGHLVVSYLVRVSQPDIVAEIADFLLRLEEAHWSFCLGAHENCLYLSVRTTAVNQKAGDLLKKIVGTRGSAGGHGTMAGGQVDLSGKDLEDQNRMAQEIIEDFVKALGIAQKDGKERLFSEKEFEKNLLLKEY